MAQYKGAATAGAGQAFMQAFGNHVTYWDRTTPAIALALNDTLDLLRVAGGTKLTELAQYNGDMDTGTTLQYKLGFRKVNTANSALLPADDDDYFVAAGSTTLQAAVLESAPTRFLCGDITFNEDVFITMTVTAAATGVSGTPAITLRAEGIAVGIGLGKAPA